VSTGATQISVLGDKIGPLYFVSAELAIGYWLFAFLSAVGALQWVAARYHLAGLALIDVRQHRRRGYLVALALVLGGTVFFFVWQWGPIFAPGPAGSELAVLFATSGLAALVATLVGASLLGNLRHPAVNQRVLAEAGPLVQVGHARGRWIEPLRDEQVDGSRGQAPMPALCLLPADRESEVVLAVVARRLAEECGVALLIHPDESAYTFPAALAILPAAMTLLVKRPDIDPNRIAVLGDGVGGDLAIRSASTSREVRAVVAVTPILNEPPVGLGLMHELTFAQSIRWARDRVRAELVKWLEAGTYANKVPPRPGLVLYGGEERLGDRTPLTSSGSGLELRTVAGLGHRYLAGHPTVMTIINDWLKEHL
jgi:hypothetical protein